MISGYSLLIPFFIQAVAVTLDEFCFHTKRPLPKWERIGHPLDTLSVVVCLLFPLLIPLSPYTVKWFAGLAVFSCLLVTKDEFVHKEHCPAKEQWLHALLFVNHPLLLAAAGLLWPVIQEGHSFPLRFMDLPEDPSFFRGFLSVQVGFASLFMLYQILYWNIRWKQKNL